MNELYLVVTISALAVISPGSDFAIVTKNTISNGRYAGYATALGIALSTWVHTFYCLIGIALLISKSPTLFHLIKYVGMGYLLYIGITTFQSKFTANNLSQCSPSRHTMFNSFKQGLLSNVANPKTTLFYLSLFTMVISKNTTLYIQVLYGFIICLLHLLWFIFVSYLISHPAIKRKFDKNIALVNKIIGIILIGIAIKFAFITI